MEPTWGRHGPTRADLGPTWGQLVPTCANLGPTSGQLRVSFGQLEANRSNMQELGVNFGPTRANIVARGQLGVNMYLGKPEKSVFRLDGSTIFTKLYVSPWTRFGRPWRGLGRSRHALGGRLGRPWGRLGRPWGPSWRTFLQDLGKTLEEPPGRAFRVHVNPKPPKPLRSTSF